MTDARHILHSSLLALALIHLGLKEASSQTPLGGGDVLSTISDVRDNIEREKDDDSFLRFKLLSEVAFGFRINGSDAPYRSTMWNSPLLSINALEIAVHPTRELGFSLGADFRMETFGSRSAAFGVEPGGNYVTVMPASDYGLDYFYSRVAILGASFPLRVIVRVGYLKVTAGGELGLNFRGNTRQITRKDNATTTLDTKGAAVSPVSFDLTASVCWGAAGMFFKFYPKGSPLLKDYDGSSLRFSSFALGIMLDL